MKTSSLHVATVLALLVALLGLPQTVLAAAITDHDSTQPRGAPPGQNGRGQLLTPVKDGFMSPAFRAQFNQTAHFDWSGMIMAHPNRDPGAMATLSVGNMDFINYVNTIPGDPADTNSPIHKFLVKLKLEKDITGRDATGRLQPEDKLSVMADICLRCHAPAGWLEDHSEPPTSYFPFLKGQFWGAAFLEYPGHFAPFPFGLPDYWTGNPHLVKLRAESEAEMDAVQCDTCHRQYTNFKRKSRFDGTRMANGNAGFFVARNNIFGQGAAEPAFGFQGKGHFCGTCHDVTNPLIKSLNDPSMLQPIERTYTEWFWSQYNATGGQTCQDCHAPMKFLGAQSWMFTAIDELWGAMDQPWVDPPFNYTWISPQRTAALTDARHRNKRFMQSAATVTVEGLPATITAGQSLNFGIKVLNNCGHKLPTGYGEGRVSWIHIKATDANGTVLFEDGALDHRGKIIRTPETKVYEIITLAEGYDNALLDGFSILDANKDGTVSHKEKEFHFVLMNFIEKDNRIPPAGYNKPAYTADGAFIVPRDPKDVDYPPGQNWDVTPYTFVVPQGAAGPISITAKLRYQTFNREYVDFLRKEDKELTIQNGGRARNLPNGPYQSLQTWGRVNKALWTRHGRGKPVEMAIVRAAVDIQ